ncbi:MAG: AI-2E family transporter [Ignavibacteria bacterium]|nr:AI-2E family transporter [Ignavibacteria bacterium]
MKTIKNEERYAGEFNDPVKPLSGIAKIFILLIPLLIIAAFIAFFTDIFIALVMCLLFALVLSPFVDFIQGFGLGRSVSILIVYAVIGSALYFAFNMIAPAFVEQSESLTKSYKEFRVSEKLKDTEKWIEKNVPYLKKGDVGKEIEASVRSSFTKAEDIISGVVSTVLYIIIIPFITFFILRDRQKIKNGLISIVPNRYFEMTINIIDKIEKQLSSYVRAWLLDAFILGLLSFIGLSIMGVNNAIIIGMVAGAGHLIPYAGPVVGGVPAILISIIQYGDFHMVLPIVILFTVIYILDSSFIQPYLFSKGAEMNPIVIIALILIGNQILGAFGALIAIPVATILKVSAKETINGFRNYKLGYY